MFRLRTLLSARYLAFFWAIIALTLSFGTASPAAARQRARVYSVSASVPVQNLVVHPPSPCSEEMQLEGNFLVQGHVVYPPGPPVFPQKMRANLHLVADGITAVGLTTGEIYQGRGDSETTVRFDEPNANFPMRVAFLLHGSNPNHPPSPCKAQVAFSVSIVQAAQPSEPPIFDVHLNYDTSLDN